MSYEAVGRRYARAIFELGKETGTLFALSKDIDDFAAMYASSSELRLVLENPLVPVPQRETLLTELANRAGASALALNVLRLLAKNRRLAALPDIDRQLGRLVEDDQHILRATVTSAGPLNESYLARLQGEIEKATGKKVILTHQLDKSLIAGVVTRIGDQVIDGSLRARLLGFRESLLRT